MFEFQKLVVYQKAKSFYVDIQDFIIDAKCPNFVKDQLSRAAFSVPLNLAEGSGKFSKADRRNFYVIARASVFECVAVVDILHDERKISDERYLSLLKMADELSRIIFSMIKNLQN